MKEIKSKLLTLRAKFNNEGSAFVDLAVKIGIGVIVGSIMIGFFEGRATDVLNALFDKIETVLDVTVVS